MSDAQGGALGNLIPWKPGESGNPRGHSEKRRAQKRLRQALDAMLENEIPLEMLEQIDERIAGGAARWHDLRRADRLACHVDRCHGQGARSDPRRCELDPRRSGETRLSGAHSEGRAASLAAHRRAAQCGGDAARRRPGRPGRRVSADAWRLGELVWPDSIEIPITPTDRQSLALSMDWKREALFGGAAGGGKSYFLLAAALQFVDWPEYRALILRRTFQQLRIAEGLLDLASEWLSHQAVGIDSIGGHPTRWRFPSGAMLDFGHCQHLKDRTQYQGGAYHFVGFDELTQFMFEQYRYIAFSRQRRRVDASIPIRVRSTSNPGGEGHDWVRDRFLMHGATIGDGSPISFVDGSRSFVASKIRDNPHLDADEYEKSLDELHPYEREMLMDGNWDARPPGSLFQREWFHVFDEMPGHVRRRVRFWDLAATEAKKGSDPDWSVGTLYASVFDGPVDFMVEDVERARKPPGPLESWMRQVAETDGPEVVIHIEQEPGSSGKIAARALGRALEGFNVRFDRPTGSKVTRSGPFASASQQGRVGVLRRLWLSEWLRELEMFSGDPNGPHDDQVDSASGAHAVLAVTKGTTWDDLYPPS